MAARLRHLTPLAALVLALVALGAAVAELPDSLRTTQARIETNAGLPPLQRELAAARAYSVHIDLALKAAEVIPRDGVFYVVTGTQPGSDAAPPFYAYWLLPRRHTDDLSKAGWVVDFGADPSQLGVRTEVAADVGGGAQVLRVLR